MTDSELEAVLPFRRSFVQDETALASALAQLEGESAIGVDVEMGQHVERRPGGLQQWVHTLALIQIAGGDLSVAIDPLRCAVEPLKRLMAGPARKVFLGGGQDAALLEKAGIGPVHVVDVGEVALAIFGRREDGMAALAHRIFGVSLDKTVRRADWSARPLNPTLIAYAHRDAELTLQIYRRFEREYPESLRFHERLHFEGVLPVESPVWLQQAVAKSQMDILGIAMANNLDPKRDAQRLARDVRAALGHVSAPRLLNRLLRIAADLQLGGLLPEIVPLTESPSSLIRASAARAIGVLAEPEEGEPILTKLAADPLEDVRKAAQAALKDLQTPPAEDADTTEDDEPSLDDRAMSALQKLRAQLESE